MEEIRIFISNYSAEIIIGLIIGYLVLFISFIAGRISTNKSRKKYEQLVQGMDGKNIEELLLQLQKHILQVDKEINLLEKNMEDIETSLSFAIRKVGFMRYNAFDDMGSELSFSLALLDDFKNGFVISSIYGREDTLTYGKEIKNGESKIPLSSEEMLVIDRAIRGQNI